MFIRHFSSSSPSLGCFFFGHGPDAWCLNLRFMRLSKAGCHLWKVIAPASGSLQQRCQFSVNVTFHRDLLWKFPVRRLGQNWRRCRGSWQTWSHVGLTILRWYGARRRGLVEQEKHLLSKKRCSRVRVTPLQRVANSTATAVPKELESYKNWPKEPLKQSSKPRSPYVAEISSNYCNLMAKFADWPSTHLKGRNYSRDVLQYYHNEHELRGCLAIPGYDADCLPPQFKKPSKYC